MLRFMGWQRVRHDWATELNWKTWKSLSSWLIGRDPDAGKDWRQEEKGMTEDEIVVWHHWHEFEQAPGVGDGQGNLARCSGWGHKELETTERLNWTEGCEYFMSLTNAFTTLLLYCFSSFFLPVIPCSSKTSTSRLI